jgi:hypothetical protein
MSSGVGFGTASPEPSVPAIIAVKRFQFTAGFFSAAPGAGLVAVRFFPASSRGAAEATPPASVALDEAVGAAGLEDPPAIKKYAHIAAAAASAAMNKEREVIPPASLALNIHVAQSRQVGVHR